MATVTSFQDNKLPAYEAAADSVQKTLNVVNASAANGDQINVLAIQPGQKQRIVGASVRVSATLGAGATVQLRLNRAGVFTVLTAATTAGAAGKVDSSAQIGVPMDVQGGDIVELLVGGAGITAAAAITVDLLLAQRQ